MNPVGPTSRPIWIVELTLAVSIAVLVAMLWADAGHGPGDGEADAEAIGVARTLVWIDRQGHRSPLPVPPRGYAYPRIAPDGSRIAVDIRDRAHGIWMWHLAAQTLTPFSIGRASDISPVWTRDGRAIVFARGREVVPALLRKASVGGGAADAWPGIVNTLLLPNSLSPDASHLIVTARVVTGLELQVLNLTGGGIPEPIVATGYDELNGELSPDGRWLAYQSRESGQFEIWVRRFGQPAAPSRQDPAVPAVLGKSRPPGSPGVSASPRAWRVSSRGGTRPVWASHGRELFYLTVNNQMMAVPISSGDDFQSGTPLELFTVPIYADLVGRTFDVSADGQRFVAVMELMRTQ